MWDALEARGRALDLARAAATRAVRALGHLETRRLAADLRDARRRHAALAARYGVTERTPIRTYDEPLRAEVRRRASADPRVRIVTTSGSTRAPKELAYSPARRRALRLLFASVTARATASFGLPRPVVFTLASLVDDGSVTALFTLARRPLPGEALFEPHKLLGALGPAIAEHGLFAVRAALLLAANPGWLYATNPSTLASFLADEVAHGAAARGLARSLLDRPQGPLAAALAATASAGLGARFARYADGAPLLAALDGLDTFTTWDGGYVRPFLDVVKTALPAPRYRFIPMFSLSTESVETLPVFGADRTRFVPAAPGVLAELLPEDADDDPARLVAPWDAEPGRRYTLVLSDDHGLVRYQSEDVFECLDQDLGLPNLHFRGRRGLQFSFTGEKLTAAHVEAAWRALERELPAIAGRQMTLAPTIPPAGPPAYRLFVFGPSDLDPASVAARFDRALAAENPEYRTKRDSGRLGPVVAELDRFERLVPRLDPSVRDTADVAGRRWESQFKLLPLTPRLVSGGT